jgi:hypothetical protein
MRVTRSSRTAAAARILALAAVLCAAGIGDAAAAEEEKYVDIYGFAMLDTGYQTKTADPLWFDVVRPTKLPAFEGQFGEDGHWFAGVRQSRFGVKAYIPTSVGPVKTIFEFELFGTGVDAGQTTFRLRHAWGELGQWGAGQTWSPFMDPDVFPNSIEYWGPNGMVFFRNVQLRWTPMDDENQFMIALERPGASADAGVYADRIELTDVMARFPYPDVSARFRMTRGWGHVQAAGIVRWFEWDDLGAVPGDLSGDEMGWGVNLSTNLKLGEPNLIRAQVVVGEGIQNYMNDAPVDVGITNDPDDIGEALPIVGLVLFFEHTWNPKASTCIGYSRVDIDNSDGQAADAFKVGQYALANVMFYPAPGVMWGPEVQWGKRENNSDGFTSDDLRVQFSFKYNFDWRLGGAKS